MMTQKVLRCVPFVLLALFLLPSCGGRQSAGNIEEDSMLVDSDTIALDTIEMDSIPVATPAKKVDELFDDFVYAFMRNKRFQRSRVNFPLPHIVDGENRTITARQWVHDPLYSARELYMTISPSKKAADVVAKDTSLTHVVVQEIAAQTGRLKQYIFDRVNETWRLVRIQEGPLSDLYDENDFVPFYCRFSTDSEYQSLHVAEVVDIKTFDDNEGRTLEGTIAAEQWPDFAPELPTDNIMCVNYGLTYDTKSLIRVVNLSSPSSDGGVMMNFRKMDGEWKLTGYDNNY